MEPSTKKKEADVTLDSPVDEHSDVNPQLFKELTVTSEHIEELDEYSTAKEVVLSTGEVLYVVEAEAVEEWIRKHGCINGKKTDLGSTLEKNTDLVPQVYEGGLKIWECSLDLVEYLIGLKGGGCDLAKMKVLELGCGAGLPGLYTLLQGSEVHFADYNWEVLDFITIPNVILNTMMDVSSMKRDNCEEDGLLIDGSDSSESDGDDGNMLDTKEQASLTETSHGKCDESNAPSQTKDSVHGESEKQGSESKNSDSQGARDPAFKVPAVPVKKRKLVNNSGDCDENTRTKTSLQMKKAKFKNKSTKNVDKSSRTENKHDQCESIASSVCGSDTSHFSELDDLQAKCKFYAGDWEDVQRHLLSDVITDDENKYDMILTSETIYSRDSYDKLLAILQALLKPGGVIYLAAKTYYFGVGGGTRDFEERVAKHDVFNIATCAIHSEGVHREILKMMFK